MSQLARTDASQVIPPAREPGSPASPSPTILATPLMTLPPTGMPLDTALGAGASASPTIDGEGSMRRDTGLEVAGVLAVGSFSVQRHKTTRPSSGRKTRVSLKPFGESSVATPEIGGGRCSGGGGNRWEPRETVVGRNAKTGGEVVWASLDESAIVASGTVCGSSSSSLKSG